MDNHYRKTACEDTLSLWKERKTQEHYKFTAFKYPAADVKQQIKIVSLNAMHYPLKRS